MIHLRLLTIAAVLATTLLLSCCGGFERYDARNPTVSQQDSYDVGWGLPPRKSRGNPQLRRQYRAPEPDYSAPSQSFAPSAPEPVAPVPAAPAPAPISPTIPASIR